jgi:hypothetical protein
MSSGLCPCCWIHTKGSEWRCAKYLEHQHAIAETNKNDIPNNPNNKNDPNPKSSNNKTTPPKNRNLKTQKLFFTTAKPAKPA